MAEIITISTRRISGIGLIRPTSAQLKYRRYYLYADIIRKPKTPYLNRDSDPPETYYGVINLLKDDYVYCTYKIKFDAEIWIFDADITGQVINTIKCEYLGVLESFANLGTALGLVVTSVENTIRDYKNLPLQWDSIRIKCFAESAIQFTLKALEYDVCTPADKDPRDPPAPPAKPESVPPGIATNISDPYANDSITKPAEIDKTFVPAPLGNTCTPYTLRFSMITTTSGDPPKTQEGVTSVWGQVSLAFRLKPGNSSILQTMHRGNPQIQGCGNYEYRDIASLGAFTQILSWSNIRIE